MNNPSATGANLPRRRQLRIRSVVPYWNDEHEICRVAAATVDTNGKRTRFFWLTQGAVGQMLGQGCGHVVNVTLKPLPQHRSISYQELSGVTAAARNSSIFEMSRGERGRYSFPSRICV